jgi:F-box and WD-40 domain protein 1/11
VSGSSDSTVRVWDLSTGACMAVLRQHLQPVLHLRFDAERMVTCSKDRTAILWHRRGLYTFEPARNLVGHEAAINVVEFDESVIITASGDRTIRFAQPTKKILYSCVC